MTYDHTYINTDERSVVVESGSSGKAAVGQQREHHRPVREQNPSHWGVEDDDICLVLLQYHCRWRGRTGVCGRVSQEPDGEADLVGVLAGQEWDGDVPCFVPGLKLDCTVDWDVVFSW